MGAVRPYLQFARLAFQRRAAYRLANFTGVAVNFFFLLVHAQVLLALLPRARRRGGLGAERRRALLRHVRVAPARDRDLPRLPLQPGRARAHGRDRLGPGAAGRPLLARARGALRHRRPLPGDARAGGVPGRLAGVRARCRRCAGSSRCSRSRSRWRSRCRRGSGSSPARRRSSARARRASCRRSSSSTPSWAACSCRSTSTRRSCAGSPTSLPFRATLYTPVAIFAGKLVGRRARLRARAPGRVGGRAGRHLARARVARAPPARGAGGLAVAAIVAHALDSARLYTRLASASLRSHMQYRGTFALRSADRLRRGHRGPRPGLGAGALLRPPGRLELRRARAAVRHGRHVVGHRRGHPARLRELLGVPGARRPRPAAAAPARRRAAGGRARLRGAQARADRPGAGRAGDRGRRCCGSGRRRSAGSRSASRAARSSSRGW